MRNNDEKNEEDQKDTIETGKKKSRWKTFGKILLGIIPIVLIILGGGNGEGDS